MAKPGTRYILFVITYTEAGAGAAGRNVFAVEFQSRAAAEEAAAVAEQRGGGDFHTVIIEDEPES